ncbi:MAG TPA: hypothetical protein PKD49_15430 [Hyphomicrobium sp.]|nr:hypothetical protein [Hyphomicrobium sp.]
MRHTFYLLPALAALTVAPATLRAQSLEPAHALAQKFALEHPGETPRTRAVAKPAQAQRPSASVAESIVTAPPGEDYERDMLNQARAEAVTQAQSTRKMAQPDMPLQTPSAAAAAPMQINIEATIKAPRLQVRTADARASKHAAISPASGRATVLLVLSDMTGESDGQPKTFDPIVCVQTQCYVSTGAGTDAKRISKAQALSTKNAIAAGAGACAGRSRCAFRDVEIAVETQLEIVNLGLAQHKRHEALDAAVDKSCHVEDGELACDHPLTAPAYRIWIVPEDVAGHAGPDALEAALADELPEPNVALDTDK